MGRVHRVLSVLFPRVCENASTPSREYNRAYVDEGVLVLLSTLVRGFGSRAGKRIDDCDEEDGLGGVEQNRVAIQRRL